MCKRTAPTREGLPPKGILIDSMGTCSIVAAAVVYFLIFIVCVIIGVMGPPTFSAVSNAAADIAVSCTTSDACTATWYGTLTVRGVVAHAVIGRRREALIAAPPHLF